MKNITFSADERLIDSAREQARQDDSTLNEAFRHWLVDYVGCEERVAKVRALWADLDKYAGTDGHRFTREEMNER